MQVKATDLEKLYYEAAQKAINKVCQRCTIYGDELKQLEYESQQMSSIYLFNLIQFLTILGIEVSYEADSHKK
jgi:hypothetical protein